MTKLLVNSSNSENTRIKNYLCSRFLFSDVIFIKKTYRKLNLVNMNKSKNLYGHLFALTANVMWGLMAPIGKSADRKSTRLNSSH